MVVVAMGGLGVVRLSEQLCPSAVCAAMVLSGKHLYADAGEEILQLCGGAQFRIQHDCRCELVEGCGVDGSSGFIGDGCLESHGHLVLGRLGLFFIGKAWI